MKRILLFSLFAGVMAASTGCGLFQSIFCYRPYVSNVGCETACGEGCDDGCEPACGPMRRPVRAAGYVSPRRAVLADCGDECDAPCATPCRRANCRTCDPCSDPCGTGTYARPWHRGPLSCLFALFSPCTWCGPTCGQRYWGDFYSDPPDCHDPCDGYGNYSGGGCSSCGGHSGSGCSSCGGGSSGHYRADDGMTVTEENDLVPRAERTVTPAPRPVATPHKAVRSSSP